LAGRLLLFWVEIGPKKAKKMGYPQIHCQNRKKSHGVNKKSEIFPYLCPPLI
jgi:hypothetical protein